MREDKRHPADKPVQRHECADCGRIADLAIFRNEGLCHGCRTKRDVEVVKRVADRQRDFSIDTGPSVNTPESMERGEVRATISLRSRTIAVEDVTPIEQIVYCRRCGRHTVAEVGQDCPHCSGGR